MNLKHLSFFTRQRFLLLLTAVVLPVALLTHLGLVAFYGDEGIRSVVALEMKISGNYLTPTLFGEFYYNKPPLYNWILMVVFELTGRNDEFTARCTTVFFLLLFAATIYLFNKNLLSTPQQEGQSPEQPAALDALNLRLLPALALVTCGRILFWDSMLALIDICFSWTMYLLFMAIFQQGEKERYGRLFAWAYLLSAIGFLLKGLPALVFLGLSLLTYFIWQKKWHRLFSLAHLGGMALFLALVGSYYVLYARHNGLEEVFKTLFHESAKRTFVEYGFWQTLQHLLTFPFETVYHFLPWTVMAVYFFQKNAWQRVRQSKFITWNLLVFLTTILPYWSSVEVYPRYLFMHIPLVFNAFFYLHFTDTGKAARLKMLVENTFGVGCLLATLASLLLPLWKQAGEVDFLFAKITLLAGLLGLLSWLYGRWEKQRMLIFALALLTVRLGFDWFVLPSRIKVECSTQARETMLQTVKQLQGRPLYIYKGSLGLQPVTAYYYTRETGRILQIQHENFDTSAYYIVNTDFFDPNLFEEKGQITVIWQCDKLMIGKVKP